MPRQNRVDPFGRLVATAERGTLMGNRGCLHDNDGRVRKLFGRKAWVTCRLEWKGKRRSVFSPGKYSELFFLDEATAFAAGHRPCNDCQAERYAAFKTAWVKSRTGGRAVTAVDMDNQIHTERLLPGQRKRTFPARIGDLPDGVMVIGARDFEQPLLLWRGQLHRWSFGGYSDPVAAQRDMMVEVLTPASYVGVLSAGYSLRVHPSAGR